VESKTSFFSTEPPSENDPRNNTNIFLFVSCGFVDRFRVLFFSNGLGETGWRQINFFPRFRPKVNKITPMALAMITTNMILAANSPGLSTFVIGIMV